MFQTHLPVGEVLKMKANASPSEAALSNGKSSSHRCLPYFLPFGNEVVMWFMTSLWIRIQAKSVFVEPIPRPTPSAKPLKTTTSHFVPQSLAPGPLTSGSGGDVFTRIDNSLVSGYIDTDSYMAKVTGGGMTNAKALQVLSHIERKLAGQSLPPILLPYRERDRVRR